MKLGLAVLRVILGALFIGHGAQKLFGSTLVSSTMITAIWTAHRQSGVWVTKGGFEYNLVIIAAAFALADEGPGALSLDEARGSDMKGLGWALASLAAAAAGSAGVISLATSGRLGGEPAATREGEPQPGDPASA
jgi:putative oxidoreductase